MPTPDRLRFVLLVLALLAVPAAAPADGGPPPARFRHAPITNLAPTAQGRLEATQHALEDAFAALSRATSSKGPLLDQAVADVTAAKTLAVEALGWLKSHPEANVLQPGPAPADTPTVRPVTVPTGSKVPSLNLLATLEALNTALGQLLNDSAPLSSMPVLNDLGGHRPKIMAAIGRANDGVLAIIRSSAPPPPAPRGPRANVAPARAT